MPTEERQEGQTGAVVDLQDQREARWHAEFEESWAAHDRFLAETKRRVDELVPLVERWLALREEERARHPNSPRCEAPRCRDTLTTLRAVPGATPDDPQALIAVCDNHLAAVLYSGLRVTANRDDTLTWHFRPLGGTPRDITLRRKRRRRVRGPR